MEETARVFMTSIYVFHQRRAADVGSASFTKDDDLAVTFVAAAANLRAHCFGIPTQSEFEAKGMAGNIIHAIATTNAIIAGYIVSEALKVLSSARAACLASAASTPSQTIPTPRRCLDCCSIASTPTWFSSTPTISRNV